MNLARAIVTTGFCALAASVPVSVQQSAPPVSIGSPGVATLRLETYVAPLYPQIAESARVSGEVLLEATIGTDGRPGDLRVMRSIPLLDQAAIDAARQWRFGPPTVGGVSAPVRVPIRIIFQPQGGSPSLPMSQAVALHNPSLPPDFAIVFASSCPNGGRIDFDSVTGIFENRRSVVSVRVGLWVEGAVLDRIYEVIAKTGLMNDTTRQVQWPVVARPEVSDSGVRVSVFSSNTPLFTSWSSGRVPHQFLVHVRMNGTWTRLYPPASWPDFYPPVNVDARDRTLQRGAMEIARLLEKHIQSFDFVRKLPRDQQWCRWPE